MTNKKISWWRRLFQKEKPPTPEPLECPVCGMLQSGKHLKMGYQPMIDPGEDV